MVIGDHPILFKRNSAVYRGHLRCEYSDEPERATTCIVLGAIIILLTLINMIWTGFHWTQLSDWFCPFSTLSARS